MVKNLQSQILDRFHIVANMNKAVDKVRAEETGRMKREGRDPVLKKSRWRGHRELILNYFRTQKLLSSGVVEGVNNKAKVTMRKSYGFRTYRVLELPSITHLASCPNRLLPTISSDECCFWGRREGRARFARKARARFVGAFFATGLKITDWHSVRIFSRKIQR
ncbi:MAG TPA: transposase [Bryobacteraceae bacterium]|nr:transposase [Bryobacteraceae bacterium]